ncbi:MAG: primosomal protein N' [Gammaproteobacteria bacterium]|nr:primosomal protein N' [Gammaproteobacteria bacterium]
MAKSVILRLAIPSPLYTCFDYLPPENVIRSQLVAGIRLRVPFGKGERYGVLLEITDHTDLEEGRLKKALGIVDESALLSRNDLELLKWAAAYYQHPLGEVVFSALPARLRRGGRLPKPGRPGWQLTKVGRCQDPDEMRRAPRQAAIIRSLGGEANGLPSDQLIRELGPCRDVVLRLAHKGWIEERWFPESCVEVRGSEELAVAVPPKLTNAQRAAIEAIRGAFGGFEVFLLDGITASGKTEVYIRLLEQALTLGKQALVLVPEIGLTPQLLSRLRRRLPVSIGVIHSGLSERERERAWLNARRGEARILLGTRSAVFAPLPELGLILVDEEHDISFKQQDGFRYSARDLAVMRGQQLGCPIVLGSATPSLESIRNGELGRYRVVRLPERAGGAAPPRFDLLDIRSSRLESGISRPMLEIARETLQDGNQVLFFLNRRGFAPVLTCHDCGWVAQCRRCDARMTYHLMERLLWCHHCGSKYPLLERCPECQSGALKALGQGTERLQNALEQLFPETRIARVDRDTTRRKGSMEGLLSNIKAGAYSLLLGTQMLAKGHHFPNVTLVGILDLDQGLFGADYRSAERMAQLIVQVAGRAGRAGKAGRVVVQTRHPDHPLLQTLLREGYRGFSAALMAERSEAGLPPFSYQVLIRAEANREALPLAFLDDAKKEAVEMETKGVELWGPVPAPMERRAGRHRAHLLLQADRRSDLHHFLSRWVIQLSTLKSSRQVRWSVDVDPQEMY